MGYYSDTAFALTKAGVKIMNDMLEKASGNLASEVKNLLDYADEHYSDSATQAEIWLWRDIKWYENDLVERHT